MKKAYVDIPEGQIHYRTEGMGEPILLLHESVCSSDEYSRVLPILGKEFRAIAIDVLGHGESDKPPHEYEIPDYAKSVAAFLDSLGLQQASIVGHHLGALISVEFAVEYPERIDKLILSGCPFSNVLEYPFCMPFGKKNKDLAWANKWFKTWKVEPNGSHLLHVWEKVQGYSPHSSAELHMEMAIEFFLAGPRGEEGHWAAARYDVRSRLPLIECPTLVLSGSRDFFYPVVEDVRNLIPRSRISIIEKGNPLILRKMPQEFSEVVISFLKHPGV